ncbi:M61 family metallopeptidase [Alteromonas sp. CYL-A6]|uniref:M61 family metallopeptidase n=1 Tax=Alteromonas nitratireducens TaxID=3390813 RepID=UPI0034B13B81
MFSPNTVLHYTLSVLSWTQHTFRVTLDVPEHQADTLSVSLPAWIPGSYMIRDFARSVLRLEAVDNDGHALQVSKSDKQTWQIQTTGQACTLSYDVFAFDLSVRSAYICNDYAFCNGTSVFLRVAGSDEMPCNLTITPPELEGMEIATGMPQQGAVYRSDSYDDFIDYPIFIGYCRQHTFNVGNVRYTLLFSGQDPIDIERIAKDMVPVCQHHMTLFGDPQPIDDYLFITLVSDTGFGGLEHTNSTALLYPRFDLPFVNDPEDKTDSYITFLSLCSHELFHTWNVKRIKPEVMVRPNLAAEVYTPQLWIYEGFTSYYDDLTLARANVISPQKYLDIISGHLTRLYQNEGRHKQSASESSFDAWTRFYKQDANSINHIVSYYTKGGIAAMGLDLLLQRRSGGKASLDELMRELWARYGKNGLGTPDNVIETLCQTCFGVDVTDYINAVIHGKDDVPLAELLNDIGVSMHFRARLGPDDKGGVEPDSASSPYQVGAGLKDAATGISVTQITEGLAAEQAGLQVGDVILAVSDYVVNTKRLHRLLDTHQEDTLPLTVIRDGKLIRAALPRVRTRHDVCYLKLDTEDTFRRWLGLK